MSTQKPNHPDIDGLAPIGAPGLLIGFVEEIHGPEGQLIPDFDATRHELLQLVRFWGNLAIDVDEFCFHFGQSGSWEMRIGPYAWRRVTRISEFVGKDAVREVIKGVEEEIRLKIGDERWDAFTKGNEAEPIDAAEFDEPPPEFDEPLGEVDEPPAEVDEPPGGQPTKLGSQTTLFDRNHYS